jgi:hypothetical protein
MPASPAPPPAPPASPARRRLFVAVTLLLPWLLLALVELGLRLGGYGGRPPLFVPYAEQPGWMMTNPEFARRYFRGAFVPTPHVDFFRAEKAPGAFRVVFQGESSAAGFPYGHGGAPSRLLEQQLQAAFPGREVEAVNAAFTAINSYAMLDQADDVLAARPDAVLIYAGHNEYYGALGAASTRALGGRRPLVRAYLALQRLRTAQLLGGALGKALGTDAAARADGADAPRSVMQLMAGDQQVPLGSALYRRGLEQFRANLAALLARYRAAGVPVFVGTVASNERDQPPFVSPPAAAGDTSAAGTSPPPAPPTRAATRRPRAGTTAPPRSATRCASAPPRRSTRSSARSARATAPRWSSRRRPSSAPRRSACPAARSCSSTCTRTSTATGSSPARSTRRCGRAGCRARAARPRRLTGRPPRRSCPSPRSTRSPRSTAPGGSPRSGRSSRRG